MGIPFYRHVLLALQVEFKDVSFRYPTRQEVLSLNQVSCCRQHW